MTAAYHLTAYRCDVVDTHNPDGCPVEEVHRSWVEAKANGWTGTKGDSRCPGHARACTCGHAFWGGKGANPHLSPCALARPAEVTHFLIDGYPEDPREGRCMVVEEEGERLRFTDNLLNVTCAACLKAMEPE